MDSDHITVSRGSYGNSVREVQCFLNERGYGLVVDGHFGPKTDKAVRSFQRVRGLQVDGVVGPQTWRALVKPCKFVLSGSRLYRVCP